MANKNCPEYQKLTWDALNKRIKSLVKKVTVIKVNNILPQLLSENLVRGRGIFCRWCIKFQAASPALTEVFAALVAAVNAKIPEVGELLVKRVVLQLKKSYERNDKPQLLASAMFIAHLVNQQVVGDAVALEFVADLLGKPSDESVEVAVGFIVECGSSLLEFSPKGLHRVFERLREIVHGGEIDSSVKFLIEGLFTIRRANFQGYPAVKPELDLVDQEDRVLHPISLDKLIDPEFSLDVFNPDPNYLENEARYEEFKRTILDEESEGSNADTVADSEVDGDGELDEEILQLKDEKETKLANLQRTIYSTIMSRGKFEETGRKLISIHLEPGQEIELCDMILECCKQERTYPENRQFCINFFTGIGLGSLTEKFRAYQNNLKQLDQDRKPQRKRRRKH